MFILMAVTENTMVSSMITHLTKVEEFLMMALDPHITLSILTKILSLHEIPHQKGTPGTANLHSLLGHPMTDTTTVHVILSGPHVTVHVSMTGARPAAIGPRMGETVIMITETEARVTLNDPQATIERSELQVITVSLHLEKLVQVKNGRIIMRVEAKKRK